MKYILIILSALALSACASKNNYPMTYAVNSISRTNVANINNTSSINPSINTHISKKNTTSKNLGSTDLPYSGDGLPE